MPSFGEKSRQNLEQLHPHLQSLLRASIKEYDFTILDAQRGFAEQELAYRQGKSKAHFGSSAHNYHPAIACDVAPWPIDFDDLSRFKVMAAIILANAKRLSIPIRWGGDWNMDGSTADGWDFPHFELHPWRKWAETSTLIGGK